MRLWKFSSRSQVKVIDLEREEGKVGGDEEIKNMENSYNKEKQVGEVVVDIERMLWEVRPLNPKCFIYQVPKRHRQMNEIAYTPQVISIGPLHPRKSISFGLSKPFLLL